MTISFYQNCGFVYSHTVPDFFTLHYDHPIVEDGKVLKDMYYFQPHSYPDKLKLTDESE